MVQWVMALATNPVNQSLFPRTHMVEGQNCLPQVVHWPPHWYHSTVHPHTNTYKVIHTCIHTYTFFFKAIRREKLSPQF